MCSLPRQRGVTEFQLKRVVSITTLMYEGQTNNPNVPPSSHPMKFWGLHAMAASTVHTAQQNFLTGSFPDLEFFIGQDDVTDISILYNLSP